MRIKHADKYELSEKRIKTVRAYAREYPEWIRRVEKMTHTSKSQRFDDIRGGTKGAGRPTENLAIKRVELTKKIHMIDQTAREADPFIWRYLIKGVTEGVPYEKLFAAGMAVSRNTYYSRRRAFYWMLSEKMYKLGV